MKATTKTLTVLHLFNLGFMGGNREGVLKVDGQYKVLTDSNEFVLVKIGGYGNLTSFPEVKKPKTDKLTEPEYRFVHDAILENISRSLYNPREAEQEEIELFTKTKNRYKLHEGRISANIGFGDKVIELDTQEVFIVDGSHDVKYINRNYKYKLVDRELHPEAETLENFIKINESKDPFKKWKKLDAMPKLKAKDTLLDWFIIDGKKYAVTQINDYYYMETPEGLVYELFSSISAPFHDTIDILAGRVKTVYVDGNPHEYVYKDVVHEGVRSYKFFPKRFVKITDKQSYAYNTRLTYL